MKLLLPFFILATLVVINLPFGGSARSAGAVKVGTTMCQARVLDVDGEVLLSLRDVGRSLGDNICRKREQWSLGGVELKTAKHNDEVLVSVSELSLAGFRMEGSLEGGDLKIERPLRPRDYTLVYFGASWCESCQKSKPGLAEFEANNEVSVVQLDLNKQNNSIFKKYKNYFAGEKIPYFALIGPKGQKVHGFSGQQDYSSIMREISI